MKKTISVLLIIAMLISALFAFNVSADGDAITKDGIKYRCFDTYCEIERCDTSKSGNVVIPSTIKFQGKDLKVVKIRMYAFQDCELSSLTIPNTIHTIVCYAFQRCPNLKTVYYEGSEDDWEKITIEYHNEGLTDAEIIFAKESETVRIDGIKYTPYETYCELTICDTNKSGNVVIPSSVNHKGKNLSVKSIGKDAFKDCSKITSVDIPNSVTSIGYGAFWNCNALTSVNIPYSVTSIDYWAFNGCGLKKVTIPGSITTITCGVFSGCRDLTSVTIPDSVTVIEQLAFSSCTNLKTVYYSGGEAQWKKINIGSDNEPLKKADIVYIADTSDGITYMAFDTYCELTKCDTNKGGKIIVPSSVNFGEKSLPVTSIGGGAFAFCSSVTSVKLPDTVTKIDGMAFVSSGITGITIPDSVNEINAYAFCGTPLTDITLPDGLREIVDYTFCDCNNLTSVTIPASATAIGEGAFYRCNNLATVYYTGSESQWNEISVGIHNDPLTSAKKVFLISDPSSEKGDINGDGSVDNKDVVLLFRYASGSSEYDPLYDYNDDGAVDNKDVVALFRFVSAAK